MAEQLLSPQEIVSLTGLSYDAVRREMFRGNLKGFKVGGRLRVRESDYEAWVGAVPITPVPRVERPAPRTQSRARAPRGSVAALEAMERRAGAG